MKASTKRTLKKVFLNVAAVLFALIFTGNIIAGENEGQVNQALGTQSSKIVPIEGAGQDQGYPRYFESKYDSIAALKAAGLAKARQVEEEGIVLLRNDGVLPFAKGTKVSLFGVTSIDPVYGGTGSGAVETSSAADYTAALTDAGLVVSDTTLLDWYRSEKADENVGRTDYTIGEGKWSKVKKNLGDDNSEITGTDAIYIIGRVGGEGADMTDGAQKQDAAEDGTDYLRLNKEEEGVLKGLKGLKDDGEIKSITVIINSANPLSTAFLYEEDYGVDAALWVGSLGQTGIYAVGDVLAGTVNPSGSLPDTWWMDNMLNPVMNNFNAYAYEGAGNYSFSAPSAYTRYVVYQEGVYLGYKYTETRYEDKVMGAENVGDYVYGDVVSYPFGFGLSYTSFAFSSVKAEKTGEGREAAYRLTVTVQNTGDAAGKKTVQIYAQKPYTDYDRQNQIEKAAVELVGYAKTQILQPGESETVTVTVPEYYLTSYDAFGTGAYILEDGAYYLTAADNAHAAANNILAQKGYTVENGMTDAGDVSLVYSFQQAFDADTYAKAMGTGADVKPLFADGDMNRYEGRGDNSIVYYSRSNWAGTVTQGPVKLAMNDAMAAGVVLDDSDLPDGAGLSFPTMGNNIGLKLIHMMDYEYDDPQWDVFMDQLTFDEMSNITLTGLRLTVAVPSIDKPGTIDHNGPSGVTQKYSIGGNGYATVTDDPDKGLKGTCYPCNGIVAATFNDKLVEEVGELIGEDAMWAGYAGLYGTGLNIHRAPYSGRVFEYYSEDGMLTGLIDTAETRGIQSKGVYVYNKHFVLNDQENNRAGIGTWLPEQALRENYLRAFELPILLADAKCVMTGYNRIGVNWCGAYPALLLDWLRGEAGMKGFAVTDMYDYTYMVGANEIVSGNDIPDGELLKNNYSLADYAEGGAKANAAVVNAMRESSKRVLYTVLHSRGMDGISENTKVVSVTPWWKTALNVAQWSLLGLTALALVLLLADGRGKKKEQ